jgi:[ribosomal protein S5]-alanine N-acetyltransferase
MSTAIITRRLMLREFTESDLPEFEGYHGDPRHAEFSPEEASAINARELLLLFRRWSEEHPRRNFQLAIGLLHEPEALIGCCGLRGRGLAAGRAEFGIEIAPAWWGRGFATEAAREILNFGFRELELQEVRGISYLTLMRLDFQHPAIGRTRARRKQR